MGGLLDVVIAWSIRQRALVLLVAAVALAAGIGVVRRAPLDILPDFVPSRVVVQTEAPGASTADVESLVTTPIERVLLGTPGVDSVRSISSAGLSVVSLSFEEGVEVTRARQLVTERLGVVRPRLPALSHDPELVPISSAIGALVKFCITTRDHDRARGLRAIRSFADWTLAPRLLAIPGVAQVTPHGGEVERIEVRPDPIRLSERGVGLGELATAVGGSQAVSGAGFVEDGAARLDVRTEARLALADAKGALGGAIVQERNGLPVQVSDVADVTAADEPPVGAAVYDGRDAVYVQVVNLPGSDVLAVTRDVDRALRSLRRELPTGARIEPPVFRTASFVRTGLWSVGRAMLLGALLVVVVLVAFLRSGRLAAISLTAIPLSIVAAVAVLVAMGASINGMTLGGLAIAVGEVVDDAIVDVENVWRRLRENARQPSPRPALDVVQGASREVRGSIVYATVIVCLVLVPVLTLGGVAGRIFSPLAVAYVLAIAASLAVALTVTPAMCAWLLPRLATPEAGPTRLAVRMTERYRAILRRAIARPRTVLAVALGAVVAALAVLPFLGGRFLPDFHEGAVIAHVHAVPGTSLEEATRLMRRMDESLRPAAARHVAGRAGRAALDEDAAPVHRMELDIVFPDATTDPEEAVPDVAKRIGSVPGLGFVVEGFLGERVHEILAGETAPVVVKVAGADLGTLRALASDVARTMGGIPGLGSVRIEPQIDVPTVRIRPRPQDLAKSGLRAVDLADSIVAWRQGRALSQILERDGRVVDVAIAGPPDLRDRSALRDLPIPTPRGTPVTLASLATIDLAPAPAVLQHDGGVRRISIGADAPGGGLSGAVSDLEDRLAKLAVPRGYRVSVGGEAVARREAAASLLAVGAGVGLGIFALLALAFSSMKDAGIVLLNFPLGLVGGVLAALVTPEGLSVAGFVGFVTLFGIIARNGIMLVAHKRHLDETMPETDPVERIVRASEERLLPIVMTAATAGLALLPLALSATAAGSELESPMALIVCGGLMTSTALNMIVLPTVYAWRARR